MISTRPSAKRLEQIMLRQGGKPRWGADYQPSFLVNQREAPSVSRPSALLAPKLGGRYLMLMSKAERGLGLLALYHPDVFEIFEQVVLHVGCHAHPLIGHPRAVGINFPHMKGTLDVMERLGCLHKHPMIQVPSVIKPGQFDVVPFPYIGDFLLFLADGQGPYCVNWTVKRTEADFQKKMAGEKPRAKDDGPDNGALRRHEVERIYYLDGDIPTSQLSLDQVDDNVRINLFHLHKWNARPLTVPIDPIRLKQILHDYQRGIESGFVQFELVKQVSRDHQISVYDAKIVLKQAIWSRHLRVDLFQPLLDDLPLVPEKKDVVEVYAPWFARLTK